MQGYSDTMAVSMTVEPLALRIARERVGRYRDESDDLMRRHAEAIDCRDCEDFLQLGIEAFNWLGRADQTIRQEVFAGRLEHDPEVDSALAALYSEWLKPCGYAEHWVAVQRERGFRVDNLEEFRKCCREAQAIAEANAGLLENDAIVELRDAAIDAYRKGETLEFGAEE